LFAADFIDQNWLRTIIKLNRFGSDAQRGIVIGAIDGEESFIGYHIYTRHTKASRKQTLLYLCQCSSKDEFIVVIDS